MPVHLQREIENLKKDVLTLGAMVEMSVREAALAITNRDDELARSVIDKDIKIDRMEVEIEEACLKILALHQPVAIDLRFIIAVLKINNDLERVGDLAVNIAERALFLASQAPVETGFDFVGMSRKVQAMLRKSLDALVQLSVPLAHEVCASDDEVDALNREMYLLVQDAVVTYPGRTEAYVHLLSVSRHFERIADHATNIAEDIIYMIEGDIVRHSVEDYISHDSHIRSDDA